MELGISKDENELKTPPRESTDQSIEAIKGSVDKAFFEVDFIINTKILRISVDQMLFLEYDQLKNVPDDVIDSQYEKLNAWRHTFLVAAEEVSENISLEEKEFKGWLGSIREEVIKQIAARRVLLIRENKEISKSWFGSITKEEIEQTIISDHNWGEIYHSRYSKIVDLKKKEAILRDLVDNLKNRGFTLKYIGEKRLTLRSAQT